MKRLLILPYLISILISCGKEENDVEIIKSTACFDYSPKTNLTVGLELSFTNCSQKAISYFWDFGDGNTSLLKEPTHTYQNVGSYKVLLMAQNEELVDINNDEIINELDGTYTMDKTSITITMQ